MKKSDGKIKKEKIKQIIKKIRDKKIKLQKIKKRKQINYKK